MTAPHQAKTAYASNMREIRSARANEYEALSGVTARLKRADGVADTPYAEIVTALHDNRRLWTAFALDVGVEGNGLPRELRAKLVYLFEFVSLHTGKILNGNAKLAPLIDINLAVMRGLMPERAAT
jgi:flagellar protein FlaF